MSVKSESGRALIEILIASMILVVGIGGTLGSFVSAGHAGATAERHELAVTRAEEELESIRNLGYDRIGMTSAPTASSLPDHPNFKVEGQNFRVLPELAEPIIMPTHLPAGTASVQHMSTATVGNFRMRIYRFVTWRDEECPGVGPDVSGMLKEIDRLQDSLHDTLTARDGADAQITNLTKAINDVSVYGNTTLNALLAPLTPQLARLDTRLDRIVGPLQRLTANAGGLAQKVQDLATTLDLCDLDPNSLWNLGKLEQMRSALAKLESHLKQMIPALKDVTTTLGTITSANLLTRLTAITNALLVLPGQVTNATRKMTDVENYLNEMRGTFTDVDILISAWADDLAEIINALNAFPNSIRDTKRVIVAVVMEQAGSRGPNKPVWASTVVTDPDAGLLG